MSEVASRELRNQTRSLLDRVAAGERITITVDGRPAAELGPVGHRDRWLSRERFVDLVIGVQADPGLTEELAELAGDSTDQLPDL